ncbi:MAG: hypothetical protein ACHQJ6_01245 [Candidatus Berkiellales bacterium]
MANIKDKWFYLALLLLTLARVLTSKIQSCPPEFDCNAYIQMSKSLVFDPHLLGHHAMRIFPSFLAGLFQEMGSSVETAFRLLSHTMYVLFGVLTFWVLRQCKVKSWVAFGFTLLCLAPHHAMKIPLQLVYQTCDIMTYPLALMIFYFTLKQNTKWVFVLACIGIATKQTLFVLGELSLVYCLWQNRNLSNVITIIILGALYGLLQSYYHAMGSVLQHGFPTEDYFTLSHLTWVIRDSKIFELIIPIIPFLIITAKPLIHYCWRHWFIGLYIAIVVGQPFIAYHLTGNNFARLALQGAWLIYLLCPLLIKNRFWNPGLMGCFVVYSLAVYFTWGISQRLIMMAIFSFIAFLFWLRAKPYDDELALQH